MDLPLSVSCAHHFDSNCCILLPVASVFITKTSPPQDHDVCQVFIRKAKGETSFLSIDYQYLSCFSCLKQNRSLLHWKMTNIFFFAVAQDQEVEHFVF